jgi:voltage-gated potassium channel
MDELTLNGRFISAFELFSVALFMVEYLLRGGAPLNPKYKNVLGGRLRYMLSPMALFDLAAFLPSCCC